MEQLNRIALFIDYENVYYGLTNQYNFRPQPAHLAAVIVQEVQKHGNILIKKAYADWEKTEFAGAQGALKKNGIEPSFALSKKTVWNPEHDERVTAIWKDSSDAVLLLDALDTFYQRVDIDEFVLVTGDRGFLDLVHRLKSRGKKVKICALESALAQELIDAVGEQVISIETLLGIEPLAKKRAFSPEEFRKEGQPEWERFVLTIQELSTQYKFLGFKMLRDKLRMPHDLLNEAIRVGILEKYTVENPLNPAFPTTAVKLNFTNDLVKELLGKAKKD